MDINVISTQLRSIEDVLAEIPSNILVFVNETANFADEAKLISKRWRESSLMLSKHSQLLEFLEIPQMMETCVRNSCYDEALKLDAYVRRLSRKHGESNFLIQKVEKEIANTRSSMVAQLINELQVNIQLPSCLRIIGYLRRMECYTEIELKIKFLSARDVWLESLLREISDTTPLVHISKLIEINRVNLFDIATQYRALFPPDESITSTVFKDHGFSVKIPMKSDRDFGDTTIVSSWLQFKIEKFLKCLQDDLTACISGEHFYPFDSIIDPCFYLGLSMSRIGADIRPQLVTIFNDAVTRRFQLTTRQAAVKLEAVLDDYSLQQSAITTEAGKELDMAGDGSNLRPPLCLTNYYPLACFTNSICIAINEIRQVSGISIAYRLRESLDACLLQATFSLRKYCDKVKNDEKPAKDEDSPILPDLSNLCDQFVNYLLPFCQKCMNTLCPIGSVVKMLGISLMDMNKLEANCSSRLIGNCSGYSDYSFTELSINRMRNELSDFLPAANCLEACDATIPSLPDPSAGITSTSATSALPDALSSSGQDHQEPREWKPDQRKHDHELKVDQAQPSPGPEAVAVTDNSRLMSSPTDNDHDSHSQ
ncbi:Conserved oligomeric Golgi complex subunit 8 [Halotydeus destructor]|nr:Conserved oligomeric Golgi complex subunit 8 [Halotydeus destructor]